MTVGEALERAEELRPGSRIGTQTRQRWLYEEDGRLRQRLFRQCLTDDYEEVGADLAWENGLQDEVTLLAPEPFDALYPYYLCARTDEALGESERCAGQQTRYNALLAELAIWLRQKYPSRKRVQWRW